MARGCHLDVDSGGDGCQEVSLAEVLSPADDAQSVEFGETYKNAGVLSFGHGLFMKEPIDGTRSKASTLFLLSAGQFVVSKLFAFEGAYAGVSEEFDGAYVSSEFPRFWLDTDRVDLDFLVAYFQSPATWSELVPSGLGLRRHRVSQAQFLAYKMPLPSLVVQRQVAVAAAKTHATRVVTERSIQSLAELDRSARDDALDAVGGEAHVAPASARSAGRL
jgi:type I restriction enzyme S subunit